MFRETEDELRQMTAELMRQLHLMNEWEQRFVRAVVKFRRKRGYTDRQAQKIIEIYDRYDPRRQSMQWPTIDRLEAMKEKWRLAWQTKGALAAFEAWCEWRREQFMDRRSTFAMVVDYTRDPSVVALMAENIPCAEEVYRAV